MRSSIAAACFASSLLASFLVCPPIRAQGIFRSDSDGITLTVPQGWRIVPDRLVRARAAEMHTELKFAAVFARVGARRWFEYPYAAVEIIRGQPETPESLATAITRSAAQPSGAAIYEPIRNVVDWNTTQTLAGGQALRSYGALRAASFGAVALYVYGQGADSIFAPRFLDSLVDGLQIDQAHSYRRPPPGAAMGSGLQVAPGNPGESGSTGTGWSVALGALAAAGLGLAVFEIFALAGRPRS